MYHYYTSLGAVLHESIEEPPRDFQYFTEETKVPCDLGEESPCFGWEVFSRECRGGGGGSKEGSPITRPERFANRLYSYDDIRWFAGREEWGRQPAYHWLGTSLSGSCFSVDIVRELSLAVFPHGPGSWIPTSA